MASESDWSGALELDMALTYARPAPEVVVQTPAQRAELALGQDWIENFPVTSAESRAHWSAVRQANRRIRAQERTAWAKGRAARYFDWLRWLGVAVDVRVAFRGRR